MSPKAPEPLLIEVFGVAGCSNCTAVMAMVEPVVARFDTAIELRLVDVLKEIDYAVRLGILATPAIAINGRLEFTSPPSARTFRARVAHYLGVQ